MGTNVAYERTFSFGEVDKAFADADRTVQAKLYWPRSTGMPMDTNGAIADYDRGTGVLTIYGNSMNFTYFLWLYAMTLKIPASKLRLVPVAAGGSFGSKFFMHKVPIFTSFLAMIAGCPVKYVEDRITHITNNDHCGSDRHYDAALAFDDDGTFQAVRISCTDDYGAYLQFGTGTHGNALSQIVGPYRIQHVEYSLAAILTNKNQQGAYRGFGAEVSNWVIERLVDLAAQDLGLDRVEIRRRNLIAARPVPLPHADRQHLRQRQLPGRAREGARGRRLRPLGRRARSRARRGPARRHRRRGLQRAQRLQLDRVLVLVRQARVHADLEPREREPADRPDRQHRRHAALAVALGQQPRDRRLAGRGRGVRRRPRRRSP